MKMISKLFILLFVLVGGLQNGYGDTDYGDAAALRSLMDNWKNSPPSWGQTNDPYGAPWEGVACENSRGIVNYGTQRNHFFMGEKYDKIIVVCADDAEYQHYKDIEELPPHRLAQRSVASLRTVACYIMSNHQANLAQEKAVKWVLMMVLVLLQLVLIVCMSHVK